MSTKSALFSRILGASLKSLEAAFAPGRGVTNIKKTVCNGSDGGAGRLSTSVHRTDTAVPMMAFSFPQPIVKRMDCYEPDGEELHLSAAIRNWRDHQNFLRHVIWMALVDRRLNPRGEPVRFLYLEPEDGFF